MLNTYEEILDNVSIEIQANNKTPTYQPVTLNCIILQELQALGH